MTFTAYTPQPWPTGQYTRYRARKACHRNAWRLALDHPGELKMVKGYAKASGLHMWLGHWWCTDREGRVVDPSWKNAGLAYIGVSEETPKEYAKRTLAANAFELELPSIAPDELWETLENIAAGEAGDEHL